MNTRFKRIAGLLVLVAIPCLQGCAMWNRLTGGDEAKRDSEALETEFRPKADKSQAYFFFDERARQIERNLGL